MDSPRTFKPWADRSARLGRADEYIDKPMPERLAHRLGLKTAPDAHSVARVIAASRCAGWPRQPTPEEWTAAWRGDVDPLEQRGLILAWLSERSKRHILLGWRNGVYTPRQAVAAMERAGVEDYLVAETLEAFRTPVEQWSELMNSTEPTENAIELPEPARSRWNTTRTHVLEWLNRAGIESGQWAIGGGSILGSRWKHRDSSDIDIAVLTDDGVAMLRRPDVRLRAEAENLGAEVLDDPKRRAIHIIWGEGDEHEGIDLFEDDCEPQGAATPAKIGKDDVRVLHNAQILWGKLDRGHLGLPKDVFDTMLACDHDIEAVRMAVNGHPRARMTEVALIWRANAHKIAARAPRQIRGTSRQNRDRFTTMAKNAAEGIEAALYTHVRIGAANGKSIAQRSLQTGQLPEIQWNPTNKPQPPIRRSLELYLDHNGVAGRSILNTAAEIARRSNNRIYCFEIDDTTVKRWDAATTIIERYGDDSEPIPISEERPELQSEHAQEIAAKAHAGQTDKAGRPYIEHVARVAERATNPRQETIAWLHDVVEDTSTTLEDLRNAGFGAGTLAGVDLLTRRPGERYQDYIRRNAEAGDPDARAVKLADLRDHLEHHPEAIGASLRRRYEEALRTLGEKTPTRPR